MKAKSFNVAAVPGRKPLPGGPTTRTARSGGNKVKSKTKDRLNIQATVKE